MILHAVAYGNVDLGIFRCNAENARQPHPEDRSGPAGNNRRGNADNRARSDSAGKGGDQSSELADVAFGPFIFHNRHPYCLAKPALREPKAAGKEQMRAQEKGDHRRPPYGTIYLIEN